MIIPVYNTELYIKQTVESIQKQTLYDIEIIIINDGSTDNSLSLLLELSKQDHRIKICYQKCSAEKLDFVFFDAESFYAENTCPRNYQYQRNLQISDNVWQGTELLKIQDQTGNFRTSACLSFSSSSFLKKNNIRFYPHIIHEDELYTALLYLNATRVKYIQRTFFKRRVRKNSITTRPFSMKNIQGYFTVANELKNYTYLQAEVREIIHNHLSKMLNAAIRNAFRLPAKQRLYIAKCALIDYSKYVNCKTICVLLFKSLLKR